MRIGIANDLGLAVRAVRAALAGRPEHTIAWVAHDGAQAVELCAHDTPDVVLMDLVMPRVDGVEATRRIMCGSPCAVLIVTTDVRMHAARVFEAMGYGAIDAVDTPRRGGDGGDGSGPLLAKLDIVCRLVGDVRRAPRAGTPHRSGGERGATLVAVGASAGGPAALATLLAELPPDFPAAIVIVQHVDERFAAAMASWLSAQSDVPVRPLREGDCPVPGCALLAARNDHVTFKSADRIGYTPLPSDYAYRPSVDVFFKSLSRWWRGDAIGVLLTGMGRDGALGLKSLRDAGHHTIAQDRASSAVFGMPKAAADLNAAVEVLALDRIAPRLGDLLRRAVP